MAEHTVLVDVSTYHTLKVRAESKDEAERLANDAMLGDDIAREYVEEPDPPQTEITSIEVKR